MADRFPQDIPRIGPHDLGGAEAGAVDPHEHDLAQWERQIDAVVRLLFEKGVWTDAAQLRAGIENLPPDAYERLGYYERWACSAAHGCVERGVVTQNELDAKVAELRRRREGGA